MIIKKCRHFWSVILEGIIEIKLYIVFFLSFFSAVGSLLYNSPRNTCTHMLMSKGQHVRDIETARATLVMLSDARVIRAHFVQDTDELIKATWVH